MSTTPAAEAQAPAPRHGSNPAAGLAIAVTGAALLLMSPPGGQTYPGAIPWSDTSILHRVVELLTLQGAVSTARGVEIKDLVFYFGACAGLLLVGWQFLRGARHTAAPEPVRAAQVLLALWVLLSLASSLWAADPALARGQALIYGLSLAWAATLAALLGRDQVRLTLYGVLAAVGLTALLCVWYYHERNPFHRPGFPLGNPNSVSAALLPGILLGLCLIGGLVTEWRRTHRLATGPAIAACVVLPLALWCLSLARGRGALIALVAGAAVILVFLVGPRTRWIFAGVAAVGLLAAGAALYWSSHHEVAMARGASMRYRLYAWRYAGELWGHSSLSQGIGRGAGAYPLLAGAHAAGDRALDPAAFMGELDVGHAHNELFEVLTEIGLVGGVTFVAGWVATFFAAACLLRRTPPGLQRWLYLGLVASIAALLADSMTGVATRSPGVPPLLYTLLGTLWAAMAATEPRPAPGGTPPRSPVRPAGAAVCWSAAALALWVTLANWSGVRDEVRAETARREGDFAAVLRHAQRAEGLLLDPVRVLAARDAALDARYALASEAVDAWATQASTAPTSDRWRAAVARAEEAYAAAQDLTTSFPALTSTNATAARAAEWLAAVHSANDETAAAWAQRANQHWLRQLTVTPCNVTTLLSLTRYPASLTEHVARLRDALREGGPVGYWREALRRLSQLPDFEQTLGYFIAAAGPITPDTDVDAIVASMAPETHRLLAAWLGLRDEHVTAAQACAEAARLYLPLWSRFPMLYSVARTEQAEHVLSADPPGNAPAAVRLLEDAIASLPQIQEQQYASLARPFRFRLALALLTGGRQADAEQVVRTALGADAQDPELVEQAWQRIVYDAAALGWPPAIIGELNRRLCPQYPTFCDPTTAPADE